jgi:hypothetical protein
MAVQHHGDGILLVLSKFMRKQEGFLIMLDPNADPGIGGSGVSYQSLGDGFFWCFEKIRTRPISTDQQVN